MKKVIALLLAAAMMLTLAACGGEETTSTQNDTSSPVSAEGKTAADSGKFAVGGQILTAGMVLTEDVLNALGTANDIQVAQSCHYDGEDTIYVYDNFSLYTYADGEDAVLYLIELNGEGAKTEAGLSVGMNEAEATALYGTDYTERGQAKKYKLTDDIDLSITFRDGTVSLIEYEAAE